jgi:phenylalanyl-tRNA synthetase alpha chain
MSDKVLIEGHHHPTLLLMDKIVNYFIEQGFQVGLGPEVETEYINFDFLRVPADHPARDTQDTFWTEGGQVLRTHTTGVQWHALKDLGGTLPLRVIAPGRVYRNEATDASHEVVLHQIDGFVIDEGIKMSHLLSTITDWFKFLFGENEIKFRPHHYPFVEPGMDIDMKWKDQWLEMGGSGMIHPEIIANMGLDPKIYSGFAFGMGLDRLTLLKTGIEDVRQLHQRSDLRVINQF